MAAKVFAEGRHLQHLPGYMGKSTRLYAIQKLTIISAGTFALPDHGDVICVRATLGTTLRSITDRGWGCRSEAQPFYVNSPFGLSMSVNGNLVNTEFLCKFLDEEARRHVNSASDSELLYVLSGLYWLTPEPQCTDSCL